MIVYAVSSTSFAALMKPMLDGSFVERDQTAIAVVPVLILLVFLMRGIATFVSTYLMSTIGWQVVKEIRQQVFDKYLDMPTTQFDSTSSGEMISRVTYNVRNIAVVAAESLTVLHSRKLRLTLPQASILAVCCCQTNLCSATGIARSTQ